MRMSFSQVLKELKEVDVTIAELFATATKMPIIKCVELITQLYAFVLSRIPESMHDRVTDDISTMVTAYYYKYTGRTRELIEAKCDLCSNTFKIPEEQVDEVHICITCKEKAYGGR